jgi:nicotinate-nucleotide--dimethylbenzimidazole phosphoribosyltransferase
MVSDADVATGVVKPTHTPTERDMTLPRLISDRIDRVAPADGDAARAARARHETLIKPAGSLGRLEDVSARLAAIAGVCPPPIPEHPAVVVAAADHGVHAQQVSPWPQALTAVMVQQFCAGTAAVNALARTVGAGVTVLDVGCATEPPDHPLLRKRRIRAGTADLALGPAMTRDEAERAFVAGAEVADEVIGAGVDLLVTGDMGIANTTASACLIGAFTGADAASVTGRGTGVDDQTLARKTGVVAAALRRQRLAPAHPLDTVAALGGLEHAALAGMMCAAAASGVPVVLDGVISDAAALIASALCPPAVDYMIASHRSVEPGAVAALDHLKLEPMLDLGLRLGEGTGGLLAVPLVQAAARALTEMATLADLDLG